MEPKRKLLIYAHYYIPDPASTGQLLRDLAEGLLDVFDVTIICVVPSYIGAIEAKYKEHFFYREELNGVKLIRIRVPEFTKMNMFSRLQNILTYFFGAMLATFKVGKQDFVFSISQPPILGGLLGVWGKWVKRAKFIYNIQDFNPEQVIAVNYSKNKAVLALMLWFDKFSCKQASKVITVGRDLVETMQKRFTKADGTLHRSMPDTCLINNWTDENEIYPLPPTHERVAAFRAQYGLTDKFVIMYSGNIGLYYDLRNLIKVIEKFPKGTKTVSGRDVVFAFVGAGSRLPTLTEYVEEHQMENVVFIPYQDKEDLNFSLNAGDVHWVVNAKGIKGVSCPSKCYGVMSAGKPILGVLEMGSECALLIQEIACGLCGEPEDYATVERHINSFLKWADTETFHQMGLSGRGYLVQHLTKEVSLAKYAEEILACKGVGVQREPATV